MGLSSISADFGFLFSIYRLAVDFQFPIGPQSTILAVIEDNYLADDYRTPARYTYDRLYLLCRHYRYAQSRRARFLQPVNIKPVKCRRTRFFEAREQKPGKARAIFNLTDTFFLPLLTNTPLRELELARISSRFCSFPLYPILTHERSRCCKS